MSSRAPALDALGRSWAEVLRSSEHHVVGDPERLVPGVDAVAPPEVVVASAEHALTEALAEVERLARRNESLEVRVHDLETRRKPHRLLKRRLSEVA